VAGFPQYGNTGIRRGADGGRRAATQHSQGAMGGSPSSAGSLQSGKRNPSAADSPEYYSPGGQTIISATHARLFADSLALPPRFCYDSTGCAACLPEGRTGGLPFGHGEVDMPRAARAVVVGCAPHVTQRGNNRREVFFADTAPWETVLGRRLRPQQPGRPAHPGQEQTAAIGSPPPTDSARARKEPS
jgi:hypothetical protein